MNYKDYYISIIEEDCDENIGGYYCEIYKKGIEDFREDYIIDYFCIWFDQIQKNNSVEYWVKKYIDEILETKEKILN